MWQESNDVTFMQQMKGRCTKTTRTKVEQTYDTLYI